MKLHSKINEPKSELNPKGVLGAKLFEPAQVELSVIVPARNAEHSIETTTRALVGFFGSIAFEILLVPNGNPGDPTFALCESLSTQIPNVRSVVHSGPAGKGSAIHTGLGEARGKFIFFTDADLPYSLSWFRDALEVLKSSRKNRVHLVTGNRRLPDSHFRVPVPLLNLAYRRHRLGLAFNKLVQLFFGVETSDTQAGIKGISRDLAQAFYKTQTCPGFLFDVELFLTAREHSYAHQEFPVTLHLSHEKSTVRVLRECTQVLIWCSRIWFRWLWGGYGRGGYEMLRTGLLDSTKLALSYRRTGPLTKVFLFLRWFLTPYSRMADALPHQGRLLDLGCGHGLFAIAAASRRPALEIFGIDHDADRIEAGREATASRPQIRLIAGGLNPIPDGIPSQPESVQAISMIDVMHYFDTQTQEGILKLAHRLLEEGGTLLVREVEPKQNAQSRWNQLYEKLATRIGFTRSNESRLFFRSTEEWEALFRKVGFEVTSEPCSSVLFADILFKGVRRRGGVAKSLGDSSL